MDPGRLSVHGLTKSFSTPVLVDVNLVLQAGEIHGLVGENGAGKSTLINILSGALQSDSGHMRLDGESHAPQNPRAGIEAGVSCVTQELSIVDSLTVAENIFLKRLPAIRNIVQRERLEIDARLALARVGLAHLAPEATGATVDLADKQLLELAKALACKCRLLLLDEPTSALTAPQAAHLHQVVREVAADGTAVIYVSHRLQDVLDIADSVTVMRDGVCVAADGAAAFNVADLVEQMSGRKKTAYSFPRTSEREAPPVLIVDKAVTASLPHPISFTCDAGEIIGLAGLAGAGRSELLLALFGVEMLLEGSVCRQLDNGLMPVESPRSAVRDGMAFLGEDRQAMGLFRGQSVLSNITLAGLSSVASPFGLIDAVEETKKARALVEKLGIVCRGVKQDVDELSGGNQQKVLIARWLHCDAQIFLLDEPTRGVDVGAKTAIYELLFELQSKGRSIIVASSEIEELMLICNRILVLSKRKLVQEYRRDAWSAEEILTSAFAEFVPTPGSTSAGAESGADSLST